MDKPHFMMLIGNIGTGKSTWVKRKMESQANRNTYVVIDTDSIIYMLDGRGIYEFDETKRRLYAEIKLDIMKRCFKSGYSVILDTTNMSRRLRKPYLKIAKEYCDCIYAVNFGQGTTKSLQRRLKDNRGYPREIWKEVHKMFRDMYEPPTINEGFYDIWNELQ